MISARCASSGKHPAPGQPLRCSSALFRTRGDPISAKRTLGAGRLATGGREGAPLCAKCSGGGPRALVGVWRLGGKNLHRYAGKQGGPAGASMQKAGQAISGRGHWLVAALAGRQNTPIGWVAAGYAANAIFVRNWVGRRYERQDGDARRTGGPRCPP